MADRGCDFEDEDGTRCGRKPTVVRMTVMEMVDHPTRGLVDDDRTVSIREEIFYCIDHLSEAYPDDGDEGD